GWEHVPVLQHRAGASGAGGRGRTSVPAAGLSWPRSVHRVTRRWQLPAAKVGGVGRGGALPGCHFRVFIALHPPQRQDDEENPLRTDISYTGILLVRPL